jgi:hypothetical protein
MSSDNGAPPLAGALDLSLLKGGNKQVQEQHVQEQLRQNGLLCVCGNRIEEQGVQLVGVWSGLIPTQMGSQDAGACIQQPFCSKACPAYLKALREGLTFMLKAGPTQQITLQAPVVAERPLQPVSWFDRVTR